METIQVVIEKELLQATDRLARRRRVKRSALVRDALRAYRHHASVAEREARDRSGYVAKTDAEFTAWNRVAAWQDKQPEATFAWCDSPHPTSRGRSSS